jgi:small subunit ribosomal protein S1
VHHVDLPEQVVTPGEELWVKIIDLDLQRRRISLSIKQAAEGGVVAQEYQEAFGEHAYDEQGNYMGTTEFEPETEAQAAWADLAAEYTTGGDATSEPAGESAEPAESAAEPAEPAPEAPADTVEEPATAAAADAPQEPPA